jgi:HAD superfamily hydrolase (TIGR01549 family)
LGITVTVVPPMLCDDEPISSSRIRSALSAGETEQAARLLGRPFTVSFPVTEGNHKGKRWGTPTVNQVFLPQYFVPKLGVYASLAVIDGKQHFAVTNVGVHPTVGGVKTPQAETWISEFSGDLYGKTVSVQLIRFLRRERCFESVEALKEQILADEKAARAALSGEGGERAILFDFDDTLQDRFSAFLETSVVFTQRHMPEVDKEEQLARAHYMTKENNGGYVNYSDYFKNIIQRWQLDTCADDLQYEYQREFPRHVKLFEETVAVLQELKRRGYRLGVVTNGRRLMQHRKLDLCGIKPLVDVVLVSGEEGVHKPDAEIFHRAAARLCTAPSNCVFIGDHPVNDIAGALSAGMKAIYLNSTDRSEHPESVTEVKHLREILKHL